MTQNDHNCIHKTSFPRGTLREKDNPEIEKVFLGSTGKSPHADQIVELGPSRLSWNENKIIFNWNFQLFNCQKNITTWNFQLFNCHKNITTWNFYFLIAQNYYTLEQ